MVLTSCAPTPDNRLEARADAAGSWQVMRGIKLATFSASDPGEYDLMIFCDPPDHVRIYHLTAPDALGDASNLILTSGAERTELAGQREEVRATPPPVSSAPGPLLGVRVHARLARDEPLMRAFLHSGRLEAISGAHVTRADASRAEKSMLAAFFEAECE
jgi:hypothetical protein